LATRFTQPQRQPCQLFGRMVSDSIPKLLFEIFFILPVNVEKFGLIDLRAFRNHPS
jgi:hypothetical protein